MEEVSHSGAYGPVVFTSLVLSVSWVCRIRSWGLPWEVDGRLPGSVVPET